MLRVPNRMCVRLEWPSLFAKPRPRRFEVDKDVALRYRPGSPYVNTKAARKKSTKTRQPIPASR